MAEDHIRYDILAQEALRGVVRKILSEVVKTGLPGEHHFFISFATRAPGVRISQRLLDQYEKEMTIVLQNQFWDLKVTDTTFEVGLSFDNQGEILVIPFSAIKGFFDPSVQFALQFDVPGSQDSEETGAKPAPGTPAKSSEPEPASNQQEASGTDSGGGNGEKVISLDAFRKKP